MTTNASAQVIIDLADPEATAALGHRLAALVQPGDLIVLTGELGAGKTTLTRGLGAGLGVRGPVTSPTFVVARRHPHPSGGTELIHVDAYRVGTAEEIDDLDLLDRADEAVTVVEWGAGRVEHLAPSRLHVDLVEDEQDPLRREARIEGIGPRWVGTDLTVLASPTDA